MRRRGLSRIDMYLWDISGLKKRLSSGALPERDTFFYIVLYLGLLSFQLEVITRLPKPPLNTIDDVASALTLTIFIFGSYCVYLANGGATGIDFARRYFAIGWVVLLRWMAGVCVALLFLLPLGMLFGDASPDTTWWEVAVNQLFLFAYYWRFTVHIREVHEAGDGVTSL